MLSRAKASSVSQVGLDAGADSVLFFPTGGVSFWSGVGAPEVLDSEPKVTPPSLVYTPPDGTSLLAPAGDCGRSAEWREIPQPWEAHSMLP
jgi:hypothetical protein